MSFDFSVRQRLLLMRHPETAANTNGYFSGRLDVDLSDNGLVQREHGVAALVAFSPDRVWTSPLSRCRDMALMAGERLGVPVEVVDELVEIDFGELEGVGSQGGSEAWPFPWPLDADGRSMPAPGGESFERLASRADVLIQKIMGLGGRTACISHGGFLRMFFARSYGIPFDRFWALHLSNVHSLYYTSNGRQLLLGGLNLSPEEVISRCQDQGIYDRRDIWGAGEEAR